MIKYIQAKSILTKYKTVDKYFRIRYSMNLYRGCQHNCIYCDSRSECYQIENFDDIIIKENAIELLKKEISKLKEKNVIGTGSMNDPYMPIESEIRNTQKALEVINKYRFPVHIITKSDLVLRDLDLIKEISKEYAAVSFTIITTDDRLGKILEPIAPIISMRFEAIKQLSKSGIKTGISLMPVLPNITDDKETIIDLLKKGIDSGISYIIPMFGMTLRDRQKDYYFLKLKEAFPDKYNLTKDDYKGEYSYISKNHTNFKNKFYSICKANNIELTAPIYQPIKEQLELFI